MSGAPNDRPTGAGDIGAVHRAERENARTEARRALTRLDVAQRAAVLQRGSARPSDSLSQQVAARWVRRFRSLGGADEDLAPDPPGMMLTRATEQPMAHLDDRHFVLLAHEALQRRGCQAGELEHYVQRLGSGTLDRQQLMDLLWSEQRRQQRLDDQRATPGELSFEIMGGGERVTEADWRQRVAERLGATRTVGHAETPRPSEGPALPDGLLITAIASLYKGGPHIQRFMANMAGQTCFADHVELIIIDAASPDGEQAVIETWTERHSNIRYRRLPQRVGVYEAWNLGLSMARGSLVTSTNVDDLRRADSLELQARVLAANEEIDIVYQDFFYTLDPDLSFDDIARVGFRSDLPQLVSPSTLMHCNPPHNAPMWRRRLHDSLGLFDESLSSASDYDFWMRCALAGRRFRKIDDPHVAYFHNPQGMSTRPDTRGHLETREIHRRYARHVHGLRLEPATRPTVHITEDR